MQDQQKFQQQILDFFQYFSRTSSAINEIEVVQQINKCKKVKIETQIVEENKFQGNPNETLHYMCIKCDMLFTNIQAAIIHQEIQHFDSNTYIQKKIKRCQDNKEEYSSSMKKQKIREESLQNDEDSENGSEFIGKESSEYCDDQSEEDS